VRGHGASMVYIVDGKETCEKASLLGKGRDWGTERDANCLGSGKGGGGELMLAGVG